MKKDYFDLFEFINWLRAFEVMARMKSRPQRTTKRKSQERSAREGLRAGRKSPTSRKRVRLQSPEEQPSTSSKKGKKKKGIDYTLLLALFRSKVFKLLLAM